MEEEMHNDHSRTYLMTLLVLLVITIVEYFVGFMPESSIKIAILVALSVVKASFIVMIFMHVKYHEDRKVIIIFGIVIPLIMIFYLAIMVYLDYGISVTN